MSNRASRADTLESANPAVTLAAELKNVQQHIARLKRRTEQQVKHLEGLADYPDLAKRAGDIVAKDSEELRLALIQLEDMKRQLQARDAKNTSAHMA